MNLFIFILFIIIGCVKAKATADCDATIDNLETIDVAIVGAGTAGSYAAWRYSTDRPNQDVHIFESTNKIGGRFYSPLIDEELCNEARAELGGMRIRSTDLLMLAVAKALNVELGGFYLNRENNDNVDDPDNIVRLRGIEYTFSELSKLEQEGRYNEIPYNFLEDVVQPSNITIKDMMDIGNFMPKTKKAEDSFCDEEAMLEIVSQDAAGIEPPVKAYRLTTAEAMHLAGMSQMGFSLAIFLVSRERKLISMFVHCWACRKYLRQCIEPLQRLHLQKRT